MKNVLILGASGNIARQVIDIIVRKEDINLTLFLRIRAGYEIRIFRSAIS